MVEELVLSKHWQTGPPTALEAAFYGDSIDRVFPTSYEELSETVRFAEATGRPLIPAGRGTHAHLGNPPPPRALVVSMERLNSILRYEPDDFTIGVQAGLPLSELRKVLEENGQDMVGDYPRQAPGTVGGYLAAAMPGPRRARNGSLGSFLIGLHGMRGGGRMYKAGGMVVKNVAGYEVGKFMVGSLGTAGVIVEINFKLRPLPGGREGGRAVFRDLDDACRFAREFLGRRLEPAVLTILDPGGASRLHREITLPEVRGYEVLWFFEGNPDLLKWFAAQIDGLLEETKPLDAGGLFGDDSDNVFDYLCQRHEPLAPLEQAEALVRISVLPTDVPGTVKALEHLFDGDPSLEHEILADAASGQLVVRWHGEEEALEGPLDAIPEILRRVGGGGWLIYLPPEARRGRSYLLLEDPNRALAERVLQVFDPRGIFCPLRLQGAARAEKRVG